MKIKVFLLSAFLFQTVSICQNNNLKIAYNVLHNEEKDDYEVFVMNIDGTGKKNISNSPGVDWVYYSYEDKLYFVSDRDTTHRLYFLYEMDADGKNIRKVYNHRLVDSWITSRNNGSEFLVTRIKDGKRAFILIDKNGNELKTVFTTSKYIFSDPSFSPDGKEIVFRSKKTGIDELWIMDDNGENLRQLTHYPEDEKTRGRHNYHAGPPKWVPEKNIISFISDRNNNYSIFTINPDGTGLLQITFENFDEGWHDWSPKGKKIVYDGTPLKDKNYDIYLMNSDRTNIIRLTDSEKDEQAPVFVEAE